MKKFWELIYRLDMWSRDSLFPLPMSLHSWYTARCGFCLISWKFCPSDLTPSGEGSRELMEYVHIQVLQEVQVLEDDRLLEAF